MFMCYPGTISILPEVYPMIGELSQIRSPFISHLAIEIKDKLFIYWEDFSETNWILLNFSFI